MVFVVSSVTTRTLFCVGKPAFLPGCLLELTPASSTQNESGPKIVDDLQSTLEKIYGCGGDAVLRKSISGNLSRINLAALSVSVCVSVRVWATYKRTNLLAPLSNPCLHFHSKRTEPRKFIDPCGFSNMGY